MKLQISNQLKEKLPKFSISAYTIDLLEPNDPNHLSNKITEAFNLLEETYKLYYHLDDVVKIDKIKDIRDGYKTLGKDPSHTRPACEALLRRILKDDQTIYRLGDVIDIGNLLSLMLLKSVCVADADKISGDITIRIGTKDDEYYGINRGKINVENLPLYVDEISPFGCPTSDTARTAITKDTKKVLIMLINFSEEYKEDEIKMIELLNKYLKIKNLQKITDEEN